MNAITDSEKLQRLEEMPERLVFAFVIVARDR
jgi:hypothetical protein